MRARLFTTVIGGALLFLCGCDAAGPIGATIPSADAGMSGAAIAALRNLRVAGPAPTAGYSRDQFGQAWTDDVTVDGGHNGCGTRDDVLRRDLKSVTVKPTSQGCVVVNGQLDDPYTGQLIGFVRGPNSDDIQIDHVVALGDSWQTGSAQLTSQERTDFANDPLELLAVDGPTNEAKGDGDAASWLPPRESYRCRYVARQIAVKAKYRLWVTPAERDAMSAVLGSCPGQPLPGDTDVDVATPRPVR